MQLWRRGGTVEIQSLLRSTSAQVRMLFAPGFHKARPLAVETVLTDKRIGVTVPFRGHSPCFVFSTICPTALSSCVWPGCCSPLIQKSPDISISRWHVPAGGYSGEWPVPPHPLDCLIGGCAGVLICTSRLCLDLLCAFSHLESQIILGNQLNAVAG